MFGLGKKKEYQLVIEFSGDSPERSQEVAALESQLDAELKSGDVDGNDVGQGITNLFIITTQPETCFAEAMSHIKAAALEPSAAGYRLLDGENYVRLWPDNEKTPFELK